MWDGFRIEKRTFNPYTFVSILSVSCHRVVYMASSERLGSLVNFFGIISDGLITLLLVDSCYSNLSFDAPHVDEVCWWSIISPIVMIQTENSLTFQQWFDCVSLSCRLQFLWRTLHYDVCYCRRRLMKSVLCWFPRILTGSYQSNQQLILNFTSSFRSI